MRYYLFVVEGVHDAAFFGRLLQEMAFVNVEDVAIIGDLWDTLVPKTFPPRGKLQHVVKYPDVYINQGSEQSVAIVVAGSESQLAAELQDTITQVDPSKLNGILIVSDADDKMCDDRFQQIRGELLRVNQELDGAGVQGIPLGLPDIIGQPSTSVTPVCVYVLPDNVSSGTLENVLIDCAKVGFPALLGHAARYVLQAEKEIGDTDKAFKKLRKGSNRQKAVVSMLGNLFLPGASLAMAVSKGDWFRSITGTEPGIAAARAVLSSVLSL